MGLQVPLPWEGLGRDCAVWREYFLSQKQGWLLGPVITTAVQSPSFRKGPTLGIKCSVVAGFTF